MAVAAQPQSSIYETTIDNAELEAALEGREKAKTKLSGARSAFKEADAVAQALIPGDLGDDAPVRCGRFVITRKAFPARSVAFDVAASHRTYISTPELP
jgi:hypothetical protein